MLTQLGKNNCFPAVTGQYWIAAGVKFTSFKLVQAFALITVQFGARFEIALLGVATLRQPPAPAPRALVCVEMALKVRFAPDDGLLSVMAALTVNSFLFDTRCKLTGGFAFCIWFKPTNPKFTDLGLATLSSPSAAIIRSYRFRRTTPGYPASASTGSCPSAG